METLLEIGKQVPALAVLAIVVYLFLKQMSESRTEYLKHASDARTDFLTSLKQIQSENQDARNQMRDVIRDNTGVTRLASESISGLTQAVRSLETEMNRNHK